MAIGIGNQALGIRNEKQITDNLVISVNISGSGN
jgi:hypothetical protein